MSPNTFHLSEITLTPPAGARGGLRAVLDTVQTVLRQSIGLLASGKPSEQHLLESTSKMNKSGEPITPHHEQALIAAALAAVEYVHGKVGSAGDQIHRQRRVIENSVSAYRLAVRNPSAVDPTTAAGNIPLNWTTSTTYVPTIWADAKGHGLADKASHARVGDLIVLNDVGHIGVVEKVDAHGNIYTIEGNSGDAVRRHKYPPGSSYVDGVVHPPAQKAVMA